MKTDVLPIDNPIRMHAAVQKAVALLDQGAVIALPTETVYGLAADAMNTDAVKSIYAIKGRPATNPLIVHVAGRSMLAGCVPSWPEVAERFLRAFWPGPLTLVLPKAAGISSQITAGLDSVALRWPLHPFMQRVIETLGRPVAAPSANLANQLSPTSAAQVLAQLKGRIPLIVDGGSASVGIESTVLDLCGEYPVVLRPGMIHLESLRAVDPNTMPRQATQGDGPGASAEAACKSPGLHQKHYAPSAPMRVIRWNASESLARFPARFHANAHKTCVLCHEHLPDPACFLRVSVIPSDPEAYARALYAELYACDRLQPELILVESVPDTHPWDGIRDRLYRASSA
ncbi:MAG: L-threonylcarbamoyladenylate synthase [Verrucomicrobiota bacterium]|nr:L-threonylcarbamoyladenylate synthase [Verrucomicrobiota bacterium]